MLKVQNANFVFDHLYKIQVCKSLACCCMKCDDRKGLISCMEAIKMSADLVIKEATNIYYEASNV